MSTPASSPILCETCSLPIKHIRPGSKRHVHLHCRGKAYFEATCAPWKRQGRSAP